MDLTEQLVIKRRRILISSAIGFALWQGGSLLRAIFPSDDTITSIAIAITFAGAFQWALFSFGYVQYLRKSKPVSESLNDELTNDNRAKSFTFGYSILFAAIAVMFAVNTALKAWTPYSALNGDIVVHSLLIIGFVCPTLYFVWLERK